MSVACRFIKKKSKNVSQLAYMKEVGWDSLFTYLQYKFCMFIYLLKRQDVNFYFGKMENHQQLNKKQNVQSNNQKLLYRE